MKIYKIRNKLNGLFFKGGHYWNNAEFDAYNWSDTGQTYHTTRGMRTVLNQIIRSHGILEHVEIVELELVVTSAKPMIDYVSPKLVLSALKK